MPPTDSFILDLANDDLTSGDGDKLPRSPLHRLEDWSSRHINGRLGGMAREEFWFEGAEGWRVMGWAVKPGPWVRTRLAN